jgi:hypothetical protein
MKAKKILTRFTGRFSKTLSFDRGSMATTHTTRSLRNELSPGFELPHWPHCVGNADRRLSGKLVSSRQLSAPAPTRDFTPQMDHGPLWNG